MTLPPRIVFYDGVCGFCNGLVRWLIERDSHHRLHYAALQGETAQRVRADYPDRFPEDIDTLVFYRSQSESEALELRSAAAFAVARELGGRYWRSVAWLAWLPRWLTDLGYRAFAASRYRIFGRLDECPIPTPDERDRFLP